jgi:hypothetical protein
MSNKNENQSINVMTEQEAIERIENDLEWHNKELKAPYKKALRMAIEALKKQAADKALTERIEQMAAKPNYTLEEKQAAASIMMAKLKETEERADKEGWIDAETVERELDEMFIQDAINSLKYRIETADEIVGKGEDGNAFADMEMAIVALGKQIAKKPVEQIKIIGLDKGGKCPMCQKYVNNRQHWMYCECGQKLDWSN